MENNTYNFRPFATLSWNEFTDFMTKLCYLSTKESTVIWNTKTKIYQKDPNVNIDTYLAALEALNLSIFQIGDCLNLESRTYAYDNGETQRFYDEGCSVKVKKEKIDNITIGKYIYISPMGSIIITEKTKLGIYTRQIYEINISEEIDEVLYERLTSALEILMRTPPEHFKVRCRIPQ